jgi:hypothetical protein
MTIGNVAGPARARSFGSFMAVVVKEKENVEVGSGSGPAQIELNSNRRCGD